MIDNKGRYFAHVVPMVRVHASDNRRMFDSDDMSVSDGDDENLVQLIDLTKRISTFKAATK